MNNVYEAVMVKLKKIVKVIVLSSMLLPFLLGFPSQMVEVQAADSTFFIGFSGYPLSISNVQNVSDTMNINGLNIYRMSFNPEWYESKPRPYNSSYVQYFLDHSDYMVIVDRNHLFPGSESSASEARDNWDTVRNSVFEVLETWPNNSRVAVELINEYVSDDFYSRMQELVDEIRGAGYTNPIVVNKWAQRWTKIIDPLDNTYQGYHFYFNFWNVRGAIRQMKIALSRGIKLINTEVGADSRERRYFTASTVNELNDFLNQSASLGVSNCVWMVENLDNWPSYQSLGLVFPVDSPSPAVYNITLLSEEDDVSTSNLGSIMLDGENYSFPSIASKSGGTYSVTYFEVSGYAFSNWITSGLVSVVDVQSKSTIMTVSGDGVISAVYSLVPAQCQLHVRVTGSGITNATGDTSYDADTSVAVLAIPNSGWVFSHWLLDETNAGSANPYSLFMDSDHVLAAVFTEIPPEEPVEYSLTIDIVGSGSVTRSPNQVSYVSGSEVILTALADVGWTFSGWGGDLIDSNNPVNILMDGDKSVVATFVHIPVEHLFEDGFESGNLDSWSGFDGRASVSTSYPFEGAYHLRGRLGAGANNGWSGAYKSIGGANPVVLGASVYFNAPPNTDNEDQWVVCFCSSTAGNALAYGGIRCLGGSLYWALWYRSEGSFAYDVSSSVYSEGWHRLELAVYRGTSNDGWVEFYVDGVLTCADYGLDNDDRALNYARVGFSYSDAPSIASTTVYIDNVTIDIKSLG